MSAQQPPWARPTPSVITHDTGLMMKNSLTRQKDKFITIDGSKNVKWYMCGPTVYAPSHMGHARTYLAFDIIRRILSDYFRYNVDLVMNITDLDDKIIQRAAENGQTCEELSRHFELEFHEDMQALGVAPPTVLTRVTEYMEEIVTYINDIVKKGLAYESNGSVYFAVDAFSIKPQFNYCKLAPEQINNAELLAEGEGKLTQDFVSDKRSPRDFALWKKSKEGEPTWPSPWGPGRPGWHIECSVMASDVFCQLNGQTMKCGCANACAMDIHSGGEDLKFPHHDNEMAQAEAHSDCCQWVNYFVHAGHLNIKGFKMSKSLKNFISIRGALETHTARQVRLCFLMHKYNDPMDYGDHTMAEALSVERMFTEFFHNVKAVLRDTSITQPQKWNLPARTLQLAIREAQNAVDEALKDDFDTPNAMKALQVLVKATNVYLESIASSENTIVSLVVRNAAVYVTELLTIFGVIPGTTDNGAIGFPIGSGSGNTEETLAPVLDSLLDFRSAVRDQARAGNTQGVLKECDTFRDDALPPLGIRLEDKAGGSVWKLADPAELLREKEQKKLEDQRRAAEKAEKAAAQAKKDALNAMPPTEFMKQLTIEDEETKEEKPKYSQFDDATGMPTHFHTNEPLNKSQLKKASKEFSGQAKKYEKYLAKQAK